MPEQLSRTIETLYRSESGRVLATLVRLLGDMDLAEEITRAGISLPEQSPESTSIDRGNAREER